MPLTTTAIITVKEEVILIRTVTGFFYYPIYSGNPDGLRWTTTSAQVYLVFMTAYGGNLNGFARSWHHAQLCLGAGSVAAAGGQEHVKAKVYLSPDN
jgi:hypothetical protein